MFWVTGGQCFLDYLTLDVIAYKRSVFGLVAFSEVDIYVVSVAWYQVAMLASLAPAEAWIILQSFQFNVVSSQ